jgi:uncharacterized repeat protein (TIGR03803 family)
MITRFDTRRFIAPATAALSATFALAACSSGALSPPSSGGAVPYVPASANAAHLSEFVSPRKAAYASLYSFQNAPDGNGPEAELVSVGGVLYGTTYFGGANGQGTVFEPKAGKERVLHNFKGGSDGANPAGALVSFNGMLYGTTTGGGTGTTGTIFAMTKAGKEHVVYSFGGIGGTDSAQPMGGLIVVNNVLYGTAASGGAGGTFGTVFAVTKTGSEHTVYSFKGPPDAYSPSTSLVAVGSNLYGTTFFGGSANIGSVYKVSTAGAEQVLYSFKGSADGALPSAALIYANGALYGTTLNGGCTSTCGSSPCTTTNSSGCGTVFTVSLAGKERVLHKFASTFKDGAGPKASLIAIKTRLYGTTTMAGATGNGTVFAMNASATKDTLLYSFKGGPSDGADPQAGLLNVSGKLYGTTYSGGASQNGTIFALTP